MPRLKQAQPDNAVQTAHRTDTARWAIDEVADRIGSAALREFVLAMTAEPEILWALTTADMDNQSRGGRAENDASACLPITRIDRATLVVVNPWCAMQAIERDVVLVAALVLGCKPGISQLLSPGANLEDVLFTLVRPALHRLDDRCATSARLLRGVLGWGCPDNEVNARTEQLHHAVLRCLWMTHWPSAPGMPFQKLRSKAVGVHCRHPVARRRRNTTIGIHQQDGSFL